jgi:pimeloyl-ACP methyl ester carboxylesterase
LERLAAAAIRIAPVVYIGAGHGLHREEPERSAADLAAFAD